MKTNDKALVLLSGGQDSATCLAWALDHFTQVETVAFDYGQRHLVELECRAEILERIASLKTNWQGKLTDDHQLDLTVLNKVSDTALTRDVEIRLNEDGLPNTFVPGRNILFLTMAAALAYRRGIRHIIGGMCETDFSGYPDCRDDSIKSLQVALNIGMARDFVLHTPLMWLDKAATWQLAHTLGGTPLVELIVEHSHTCYLGERSNRYDWGYGCGTCPACEIRARGYHSYREGP